VTDDFLTSRGIDPSIWGARGCRRYQQGDTWVKEEFRPFLPSSRLGTVTRIVNQRGGWFMPKHPPPGFPPIPAQLRPDKPGVILDKREVWHFHGPKTDEKPVFPDEAGKPAGKYLPRARLLFGAAADAHVNRMGDPDEPKPYNPETGEGEHRGQAIDVVHKHAPRDAKYVLLGEGARIDLHPLARRLLPEAQVVFFVLEGTPKTDAVLSAGGVAFGVPSVTCWTRRELADFADRQLRDKTVLVVPDADWYRNPAVERQALKIRTVLRRLGIDSYVCAPPYDAVPRYKGVDDHLGAGKTLGDLMIEGREPPIDRIWEAVRDVAYRRRKGAAYALENLSLYTGADGKLTVSFPILKRLLDIRDSYRVPATLESIAHALTVEHGSLETVKRSTFYGRYTETVWKQTPTISLDEYYRAYSQRAKLLGEDFYKDAAFEMLRDDVEELKRWRRNVGEEAAA
jgi:hypothetical protein